MRKREAKRSGRVPDPSSTVVVRLTAVALALSITVLLGAGGSGCGKKESARDASTQAAQGPSTQTGQGASTQAESKTSSRGMPGDTTAGSMHPPDPSSAPGARSTGSTVALPSPAGDYGYDRAAEYVRDLQERVDKIRRRLEGLAEKIRATDAPETAEMDARLQTLQAIAEDIMTRSVDAENSATEKNWPVWQVSLEKEMANLVRGGARLDSMVTAVRRSP